jgi:hypothetical protein
MNTISFPEYFVIIGNVVSAVVVSSAGIIAITVNITSLSSMCLKDSKKVKL